MAVTLELPDLANPVTWLQGDPRITSIITVAEFAAETATTTKMKRESRCLH